MILSTNHSRGRSGDREMATENVECADKCSYSVQDINEEHFSIYRVYKDNRGLTSFDVNEA